jgi:4-amino-4-deoxy-L-arabinose transferase-like glycosyltransferase
VTRRRQAILVAGITLVGAALRLLQIGDQSFWYDELFTLFFSRLDAAEMVAKTAQDIAPPLYYLIVHVALQFGSDETAVRLPSFFFSVATIPLMYVFARRLFDERIGLVSAAGLALNPLHVFYGQEARMYAVLGFLTVAAVLFFHRAWFKGGFWNWALFALTQSLALYAHSLAGLILFALDIFVLFRRGEWRERWQGLVLAHLFIFIAFLPWLGILYQQAVRVQEGFWASTSSPLVLVTTPYLFLFGDAMPPILVPVALFAGLALLTLSLVAAVRAILAHKREAASLQFVLALSFVPLFALYLLSLNRPTFLARTLLPASFALYLLLAWAVVRGQPRMLNVALGVVVLVGMMAALANFRFNPAVQKPPLRQAAQALIPQLEPGDIVAHTSDLSAFAFDYYAPQLDNHFLSGDPDYLIETMRGQAGRMAGLVPEDCATIIANASRLWVVVALDHSVEYQQGRVREFDAAYKRIKVQNVGGISIYLYQISAK